MKNARWAVVLLICAAMGCASGKLKTQQAKIEQCEIKTGELRGQVKDCSDRITVQENDKNDLKSVMNAQISDLEEKLNVSQSRIDSLVRSNKDLSSAIESKKSEISGRLKAIVAEKDELSLKLNALEKEKVSADRIRTNLLAKREKLLAELASLKQKQEDAQAEQEKVQAERRNRLAKTHEDMGLLVDAVLKDVQSEQVKVAQDGEAIVVTLQEPLLFKPQQAKLTESGLSCLDRLGRTLQALGPRSIRVEGHSDNSPIKWELFGNFTSHWDLSSARATAVARYFHEHSGLDPRHITAAGFGEFRPIKGNDTPEGREANRRMMLIVEPLTTP